MWWHKIWSGATKTKYDPGRAQEGRWYNPKMFDRYLLQTVTKLYSGNNLNNLETKYYFTLESKLSF